MKVYLGAEGRLLQRADVLSHQVLRSNAKDGQFVKEQLWSLTPPPLPRRPSASV